MSCLYENVKTDSDFWEREAKRHAAELGEQKIGCVGCRHYRENTDTRCDVCKRKERTDFYEPV